MLRGRVLLVVGLILVWSIAAFASNDAIHMTDQTVPSSTNVASMDMTPLQEHFCELDEAYVLLVQDSPGWANSNEEILISLAPEVTYDLITSASLATTDLSVYTFVVIGGGQSADFNQNVLDNMAVLEEYVGAGGWLQMHMATNSHQPHLTLWDGTTYQDGTYDAFNWMGPDGVDHPILVDMVEPYEGKLRKPWIHVSVSP